MDILMLLPIKQTNKYVDHDSKPLRWFLHMKHPQLFMKHLQVSLDQTLSWKFTFSHVTSAVSYEKRDTKKCIEFTVHNNQVFKSGQDELDTNYQN